LRVAHNFTEPGDYICIVTAGHPSKNTIYLAAFPLSVGGTNYLYVVAVIAVVLLLGLVFVRWQIGRKV
jgi:hypothetical protein